MRLPGNFSPFFLNEIDDLILNFTPTHGLGICLIFRENLYRLPVKVVVLNNYGDGMVRQWQKLYYDSRMSASDKSLHRKDFVRAAEADGFEFARKLDKKVDIDKTIAEFMAFEGPAFLEVIIDPDAGVYPMVGPGLPYSEMITGDYIRSRSRPGQETLDPSELF